MKRHDELLEQDLIVSAVLELVQTIDDILNCVECVHLGFGKVVFGYTILPADKDLDAGCSRGWGVAKEGRASASELSAGMQYKM